MGNLIVQTRNNYLSSNLFNPNAEYSKTGHCIFVNTANRGRRYLKSGIILTDNWENGPMSEYRKVTYQMFSTVSGRRIFSFDDCTYVNIYKLDDENFFTFSYYLPQTIIKFYSLKTKQLTKQIVLKEDDKCYLSMFLDGKIYYKVYYENNKSRIKCIDIHTQKISTVYDDGYAERLYEHPTDKKKLCIDLYKKIIVIDAETYEILDEASELCFIKDSDLKYLAEKQDYANNILIYRVEYSAKQLVAKIPMQFISNAKGKVPYCSLKHCRFSEDKRYIVAIFEVEGMITLQVNDIYTHEKMYSFNSNKIFKFSSAFISFLNDIGVCSEDIDTLNRNYYTLTLEAINNRTIGCHHDLFETAFCPYTGNIGFENFSDRTFQVLDTEKLMFDRVYDVRNEHTKFILNKDMLLAVNNPNCKPKQNHILYKGNMAYAEFSNKGYFAKYAMATKIRLDTDSMGEEKKWVDYEVLMDGSVRRIKGINVISDINDTYLISLSEDEKELVILNYREGIVRYKPIDGLTVKSIEAAHNPNIFFITDTENNIYKYEISKEAISLIGQLPFKDPNYRWFKPEFMMVSADGKYIVTLFGNEVTVYDANTFDIIVLKELADDFKTNSKLVLKHIDIKNRFILIELRDVSVKYLFLDIKNLERLATLHIFSNKRYLWETPPDEVALHGWFFTNTPEMINVFTEDINGNIELLDYEDERRERYIETYNRQDIVKKRVLEKQAFEENIKHLFEKQNNSLVLSQLNHQPLLLGSAKE